MNKDAILINSKLGVEVFDPTYTHLVPMKYSKKEIYAKYIDDLIDPDTFEVTDRLFKLANEILNNAEKELVVRSIKK
jgi:hypothetical protein